MSKFMTEERDVDHWVTVQVTAIEGHKAAYANEGKIRYLPISAVLLQELRWTDTYIGYTRTQRERFDSPYDTRVVSAWFAGYTDLEPISSSKLIGILSPGDSEYIAILEAEAERLSTQGELNE